MTKTSVLIERIVAKLSKAHMDCLISASSPSDRLYKGYQIIWIDGRRLSTFFLIKASFHKSNKQMMLFSMDHKSRSQDIENPTIKIQLLPKYIERLNNYRAIDNV